jgi:hypothetical protein
MKKLFLKSQLIFMQMLVVMQFANAQETIPIVKDTLAVFQDSQDTTLNKKNYYEPAYEKEALIFIKNKDKYIILKLEKAIQRPINKPGVVYTYEYIPKIKSAIRINQNDDVVIVYRKEDIYRNFYSDPYGFFSICKTPIENGNRKTDFKSFNIFSRYNIPGQELEYDYENYGQNSFKIILKAPLKVGEYAIKLTTV